MSAGQNVRPAHPFAIRPLDSSATISFQAQSDRESFNGLGNHFALRRRRNVLALICHRFNRSARWSGGGGIAGAGFTA